MGSVSKCLNPINSLYSLDTLVTLEMELCMCYKDLGSVQAASDASSTVTERSCSAGSLWKRP